jgi:hypothetical protein
MNKSIYILAIGLVLSAFAFTACEKGSTIGSIGRENPYPIVEFDTFVPPSAVYYFWGVFDGHFRTWEDGIRSDWDTATRKPLVGMEDDPWDTWPVCTDNIYVNVCNEGPTIECPYGDEDYLDEELFYKHQSRFIRPEIPGERIEINFYQCANFVDTPSVNFVYDSLDLVRLGAWPFSNLERGEWGAEIVYIDKNRDRWSTQSGSGNTTDSYFRLTDLYPRSNPDTTDTFARFVIEGEFAGRIYNGGNEIAITNSKFRAKLVARKPVGFE